MHKPILFKGRQVGVVPRLEGLGALWGLLGKAVKCYPTERERETSPSGVNITGYVPSHGMA